MSEYDSTLLRLNKSKFRRKFKLGKKELDIIKKKGLKKIESECREILEKRIKVKPKNDGRQTPWKNHPVFIGMHATACCCRKCIQKWYKIPRDRELKKLEIDFFIGLIMAWIKKN